MGLQISSFHFFQYWLLFLFIIHVGTIFQQFLSPNALGTSSTDIEQDKLYTGVSIFLFYGSLFSFQLIPVFLNYPRMNFLCWIGSFIFFSGIVLRLWSIKILGDFFTMKIGIRKGHEVISNGPYKIIRHPSYSGYLLILLGYALCAQHLLAFIPIVMSIGFLNKRIREEEAMLIEHFGKDYLNYMKKSYRIIPGVF